MTTSTTINAHSQIQNVFQQITNQHLPSNHQHTATFVNAMNSQYNSAYNNPLPQNLQEAHTSLTAQNQLNGIAQMAVFESLSTQIENVSNKVESVVEQLFLMQTESFLMHQQISSMVQMSGQSSFGGFGGD